MMMARTLPKNSTDLLNGHHNAQLIAEACSVAFWLHGRDDGSALFNMNKIHEQFAALADALGYDVYERVGGEIRVTTLEGFVADFAATDFPAIRSQGYISPEDEPDEVTELAPIEAWQEDARALIAPQPAMQEAAE